MNMNAVNAMRNPQPLSEDNLMKISELLAVRRATEARLNSVDYYKLSKQAKAVLPSSDIMIFGLPFVVDDSIPVNKLRVVYNNGDTEEIDIFKEGASNK